MNVLSAKDISIFVRYVYRYHVKEKFTHSPYLAYEYRMAYVIGGRGCSIINGVSYPLQRGDFLLYPPGVPYMHLYDAQGDLEFIKINFDFTHSHSHIRHPLVPDLPENFRENEITETCEFSDFPILNTVLYLRNMHHLEPCLLQINQEFTDKKIFYEQRVTLLSQDLLFSVMRTAAVHEKTVSETDQLELVNGVLSYIHEHYSEPLTNQSIADALNYCAPHLNRLVRLHTGQSLHQYLLQYRLSRATDLLAQTGMSITDVAFATGFSSLIHFERAFKEKLGYPPSYIRRR